MANKYKLLDDVNYPSDLKRLSESDLTELSAEIRKFLIENVSVTGGHLASNLGVVELTCALHYCFDLPTDKIVWDVGHQSYVHKILTGRKELFHTLRQKNGMSGFTKTAESEYDCYGAGHSSTSISAALGFAVARDLKGESNKVVAVIGDGAISGGLAFEALNNAGQDSVTSIKGANPQKLPTDLIIIINDNEMSISKNVGALSKHLNDLRTAPLYTGAKEDVHSILDRIHLGGKLSKVIESAKDKIKYMLISGVLFEEMGFKYYGPIDGHDVNSLINVLNKIKNFKEPIVLHVYTKKGKGYKMAEENPNKFHGAAAFDALTGIDKKKRIPGFSDVFGDELIKIGERNESIVAITAAMKDGCGLRRFAKKFPERFFDVGIAEGHAVVFGAGLAASGMIPVFAVYSTFLQRSYDSVLHDVCLQNLPFVFAIDRAGAVSGDGATHQGIYDISFMNHIPNMTIMAPRDQKELRQMLNFAVNIKGPAAIRYSKENVYDIDLPRSPLELGRSEVLEEGADDRIAIIALGAMVKNAIDVSEELKMAGIIPAIVNARFAKPFDEALVERLAGKYRHIFTIEDGVKIGGFGSRIAEFCRKFEGCKVTVIGYDDIFPEQGTREEILSEHKLDKDGILKIIKGTLEVGAANV